MQALDVDDDSLQRLRALEEAGAVENIEAIAAQVVLDHDVVQPRFVAIEQTLEQVDGVPPGVHDVPVADAQAQLRRDLQELRLVHPLHQRILCLCGQIDEHATLR